MDKKTVEKVAALGQLEMGEAELTRMGEQITGILQWVEQLSEVNTDKIEPLANVVDIPLTLRDDVINDGDCMDKVLANAPETAEGFFVVPKIVEQEA